MKKSTERFESRSRALGSRDGFTLLEVLAAVAILGIWFAVLANVAIQGLRSEGENERRIRASLLADRVLTNVELNLDAGELPGENVDVQEEDEFTVEVEQLPLAGFEFAEPDPALMEMLEGDLGALAADLYTIQVHVTWIEGATEEAVHRTTYAWDSAPLLEALSNSAPAEEDEAQDDEYEDGEGEYDEEEEDLQ